jgi:hypothetical protein
VHGVHAGPKDQFVVVVAVARAFFFFTLSAVARARALLFTLSAVACALMFGLCMTGLFLGTFVQFT